jgi:hypothetical protein
LMVLAVAEVDANQPVAGAVGAAVTEMHAFANLTPMCATGGELAAGVGGWLPPLSWMVRDTVMIRNRQISVKYATRVRP